VIPVLGVGFTYPLTEQMSVSGQAGGRYAFYTIDLIDNKTGQRLDPGKVRNPWGFAAEATLNYLAYERLFVQAGYRYEWLHATTDSGAMEFDVNDQAHGPVLAVVYLHQ
jgi:outer membrane receptor protein involved in Fe transport